jgi:hypothetical protein
VTPFAEPNEPGFTDANTLARLCLRPTSRRKTEGTPEAGLLFTWTWTSTWTSTGVQVQVQVHVQDAPATVSWTAPPGRSQNLTHSSRRTLFKGASPDYS